MRKKVLVLMSSYNGEIYIEEQISSILAQENVDVNILVRDDGSTDGTKIILQKYQDEGKLCWYEGDNLGPAKSFMNLLYNADKTYDYYAFSDQDDYWMPNKLNNAITSLEKHANIPALYFCGLDIVDRELNHIRYIDNCKKCKFVPQTLLVFYVPGCSMVFNNVLLRTVRKKNPNFGNITMHDCWLFYSCMALNGKIISDPNAQIKYRQHSDNAIGAQKVPIRKKLEMILLNRSSPRAKMVKEIVKLYGDNTNNNVKIALEMFSNYPSSLSSKMYYLCLKTYGAFSQREFIKAKCRILFNSL